MPTETLSLENFRKFDVEKNRVENPEEYIEKEKSTIDGYLEHLDEKFIEDGRFDAFHASVSEMYKMNLERLDFHHWGTGVDQSKTQKRIEEFFDALDAKLQKKYDKNNESFAQAKSGILAEFAVMRVLSEHIGGDVYYTLNKEKGNETIADTENKTDCIYKFSNNHNFLIQIKTFSFLNHVTLISGPNTKSLHDNLMTMESESIAKDGRVIKWPKKISFNYLEKMFKFIRTAEDPRIWRPLLVFFPSTIINKKDEPVRMFDKYGRPNKALINQFKGTSLGKRLG